MDYISSLLETKQMLMLFLSFLLIPVHIHIRQSVKVRQEPPKSLPITLVALVLHPPLLAYLTYDGLDLAKVAVVQMGEEVVLNLEVQTV